eukprot:5066958-Karenia_brevis.AAC.1
MIPESFAHAARAVEILEDFDCRFDADSKHHPLYMHMQINTTGYSVHGKSSIDIGVRKFERPAAVSTYKTLLHRASLCVCMSIPSINFSMLLLCTSMLPRQPSKRKLVLGR